MPNATLLAPIVKATLLTSVLPSILKLPVTSPVANVTVLGLAHLEAVSALPVSGPVILLNVTSDVVSTSCPIAIVGVAVSPVLFVSVTPVPATRLET